MRILNIIKTDLNTEKLKLEEEFQRVVNYEGITTNKKIVMIKKILREIAIIELSYTKFEMYMNDSVNNNNEKK